MTARKRTGLPAGPAALDLSHLNAVPLKIFMPEPRNVLHLYLVGAGGTGSWLAPHVVRLARLMRERGRNVEVTLIDPDVVELKNVFRQNFGTAEIGARKAEALALRYGPAWEVPIRVYATRFEPKMIDLSYGDVGVIIGCVDNAAARRSIAEVFSQDTMYYDGRSNAAPIPRLWWLDAGNGEHTGQVLFGATRSLKTLRTAFPHFPESTYCIQLPSPVLQHPDLLPSSDGAEPRPNETSRSEAETGTSCAQRLWTGDQSPSINSMIANIAATYLWRLFADAKGLTTFATYCDLQSFSLQSRYITPDTVAQSVGLNRAGQWFASNRPRQKTTANQTENR